MLLWPMSAFTMRYIEVKEGSKQNYYDVKAGTSSLSSVTANCHSSRIHRTFGHALDRVKDFMKM